MDGYKKAAYIQGIKAGTLSFVLSCLLSLVLALVAKVFSPSDSVIAIVNQVLKILAMGLGVLFIVRDDKLLLKAVVAAVVCWLLSTVCFCIFGEFVLWRILLDLLIMLSVAVICVLFKAKR